MRKSLLVIAALLVAGPQAHTQTSKADLDRLRTFLRERTVINEPRPYTQHMDSETEEEVKQVGSQNVIRFYGKNFCSVEIVNTVGHYLRNKKNQTTRIVWNRVERPFELKNVSQVIATGHNEAILIRFYDVKKSPHSIIWSREASTRWGDHAPQFARGQWELSPSTAVRIDEPENDTGAENAMLQSWLTLAYACGSSAVHPGFEESK